MTDQEKIERLARWMRFESVVTPKGIPAWKHFHGKIYKKLWNPLTNIADARMLVERAWQEAIKHRERHVDPVLIKSEEIALVDSIAMFRPGKVPKFEVCKALDKRSKQEKLVYKLGCILACSISWKARVTARYISYAVLEMIE